MAPPTADVDEPVEAIIQARGGVLMVNGKTRSYQGEIVWGDTQNAEPLSFPGGVKPFQGTTCTAKHAYKNPGKYTIKVKVYDAASTIAEDSYVIVIGEDDIDDINGTDDNGSIAPPMEDLGEGWYIVHIEGAGYVPHWAGGSFILEGGHNEMWLIEEGDTIGQAIERRRQELTPNVCELRIPGVPGLEWIPSYFTSGPTITRTSGPYSTQDEARDYFAQDKTWHQTGRDGPSLYELQKGCRPQS